MKGVLWFECLFLRNFTQRERCCCWNHLAEVPVWQSGTWNKFTSLTALLGTEYLQLQVPSTLIRCTPDLTEFAITVECQSFTCYYKNIYCVLHLHKDILNTILTCLSYIFLKCPVSGSETIHFSLNCCISYIWVATVTKLFFLLESLD